MTCYGQPDLPLMAQWPSESRLTQCQPGKRVKSSHAGTTVVRLAIWLVVLTDY